MTPQQQIRELRNKLLGEPMENDTVSMYDLLFMLNIGGGNTLDLVFNGAGYSIQSRSSRNGIPVTDIRLDLPKKIECHDEKTLLDIIKILT